MYREGFPVFKGLQKPLELMGIRGRFLTLAAGAIGVSFIGFIVFSILVPGRWQYFKMWVRGLLHGYQGRSGPLVRPGSR